jgi:RNase P/RNase MRP subunit POP5
VKGSRRYRYITFHVEYEDKKDTVSTSHLIQELRQQAFSLFSKSLKDLRLWVIQFDGKDGILKCHYLEKDHIIQLLVSLKNIGNAAVTVQTFSTSGTLKSLLITKRRKQRNN